MTKDNQFDKSKQYSKGCSFFQFDV